MHRATQRIDSSPIMSGYLSRSCNDEIHLIGDDAERLISELGQRNKFKRAWLWGLTGTTCADA